MCISTVFSSPILGPKMNVDPTVMSSNRLSTVDALLAAEQTVSVVGVQRRKLCCYQ